MEKMGKRRAQRDQIAGASKTEFRKGRGDGVSEGPVKKILSNFGGVRYLERGNNEKGECGQL